MYASSEKLKRVSDTVYQEAEPPADRTRPLEWRRSFNSLHLRVRNLRLIRSFDVNDVDVFYDVLEREDGAAPEVASKIRSSIRIVGDVDQGDFRDTILFSVPTERHGDVYTLEKAKGQFTFQIRAGEPTTTDDGKYQNVYWGNLGRYDFEPGEDGVWIEVTAPQECLDQIADSLSEDPSLEFFAHVSASTFSHEVDDALREHYHRRDLFAHEGACVAFLSSIQLNAKGIQPVEEGTNDLSNNGYADEEINVDTSDEDPSLNQNAATIVAAIKSLRVAVYIAAAAIVIALVGT